MNLKCYDFSDIKIGVQCEKELDENEMLKKFGIDCKQPDVLIKLEFRHVLPSVPDDEVSSYVWNCRKTRLEENSPEQPFVCTEFRGNECNMYVTDKHKQTFDMGSVFRHLPLHHLLLRNDAVILHGAYIIVNGEAIVFSAPSGTGKSTQAELWRKVREDTSKIYMPAKCTACADREVCMVCAAACHCETGHFGEAPEYICQRTKALIEESERICKAKEEKSED